jgi:RNA polymerase sigma-70 factor (ECF subfamily)
MRKLIEDYIVQGKLDMSKIVDDFYNYISTIVRNAGISNIEDQEEIVYDVFFILWKNQDRLERNVEFGPYISGVTKKLIYKKYNEIKISGKNDEYEDNIDDNMIDEKSIEEYIENKSTNDYIIEQLSKIGELESEIFIKFYYEDKSIKSIAEELNLSNSNIKTKLCRTRKKLKELLDKGGSL